MSAEATPQVVPPVQDEIEVPEPVKVKVKPQSVYAGFETDLGMEQQGILLDLGPYGVYTVARAAPSNIKYTRTFKRYHKPYEKMVRRGTLPEEQAKALLIQIYAESIVLGWEGVYDRHMKPIPYSIEAAIKLFTDLPDLFTMIIQESLNAESYRVEFLEEASKNL